jgi:elongation factor 2
MREYYNVNLGVVFMAAKDDHSAKVQALMNNQKNIRNIGIVSHIHHGKTVLTDNLAAKAGMIAGDLVGDRMLTWIDDQERERLMTIYGATVTMPHVYQDEKYLINLLDTPGHVDFGADVTQAMRAVDGGVVVVCAVEGIMPQTETVLKQALQERVKPVLFINKVDRAIKELQLTPEQLLARLTKIVINVNKFIQSHIEDELKGQWIVKVEDGSVAFGSALKKWAISVPSMKQFGVTFKEIIEKCTADEDESLAEKTPMHVVVMDMVVKHLPNPLTAQKYRIKRVWTGDVDSEFGKRMIACDPEAHLGAVITKVVYDPHAGMICTARIFSGRLKQGQEVYLSGLKRSVKVQQVTTFIASKRLPIEEAVAGNIIGIVGFSEAIVGETMSNPDFIIDDFQAIKHIFEPVVTKSIEPKSPQDLPKLIDILKTLNREDPTLKIQINQETGETLVSGLGELHLDAKVERKIREKGINIIVSPPIVVYREAVTKQGPTIVGKSPNKHNKFWISVSPISKEIYKKMEEGDMPDQVVKGKNLELFKKLQDMGMSKDDSRAVKLIYNHCLFLDATKGIQYLNEAMEHIINAFKSTIDAGPLAKEPCSAVLVKLEDAALHEDAIHRGPAQIMPAVRGAIFESMVGAGATLFEPKQVLRVDTPQDVIGSVTGEVSNRRGEILNMEQEEHSAILTVKLPVAEMFGFEPSLKSATKGKGFQSLMEVVFEKVPATVKDKAIATIRKRKGLTLEEKEE